MLVEGTVVEEIHDTELIMFVKIYIPVSCSLTLATKLTIEGLQIYGCQDYDVNAIRMQ